MKNTKKYLMDGIDRDILEKSKDLEESKGRLDILMAELRVEGALKDTVGIPLDVETEVGYSISSFGNLIGMEENTISELMKEIKMLEFRKTALNKFGEFDLDSV